MLLTGSSVNLELAARNRLGPARQEHNSSHPIRDGIRSIEGLCTGFVRRPHRNRLVAPARTNGPCRSGGGTEAQFYPALARRLPRGEEVGGNPRTTASPVRQLKRCLRLRANQK